MRSAGRFQGVPGTTPVLVDFELAPDLDGEMRLSTTDLRHRAVLSGIWEVGRGFQMSGTHYTAIGERAETIYGGDLRNLGSSSTFIQRLRPDEYHRPRNSFTQPARNRTNLRVQQRVPLPRQASLDLIAEAFNVFNSRTGPSVLRRTTLCREATARSDSARCS